MISYWMIISLVILVLSLLRPLLRFGVRRTLRQTAYRQYLHSPEWAERRAAALQAAGWMCRNCHSTFHRAVAR
jgi:hypothetical protein